jgi:DNA-binding transcriptional ArsR family regulator
LIRIDEEKERLLGVLASKSRLKILAALWKASGKELTAHRISQSSGLKKKTVYRQLPQLVENRLVSKKIYGTICLYALNKESREAEALARFFTGVLSM